MSFLTYEGISYEITIEKIDADTAKKYLKNPAPQRKIDNEHVNKLAQMQKKGDWKNLNGDTIVFNDKNQLTDGQHRMKMVIKTGIPIVIFVVRGVSHKAKLYCSKDHNKPRTTQQSLQILGYKNANTFTAVLRMLFVWKNGLEQQYSKGINKGVYFNDFEALRLLDEHPALDSYIGMARKLYRKQKYLQVKAKYMGFYCYVLPQINHEIGNEFVNILIEKLPSENTPIDVLLRRLALAYASKNPADRILMSDTIAMINKTWNLYVTSQHTNTVRSIVWRYNEKFPALINEYGEKVNYNDITWRKIEPVKLQNL